MKPSEDNIRDAKENAQLLYQLGSRTDFMLFVRGIIIAAAYGPVRFNTCIASFQRQFFRAVCPSFTAAKNGDMPPVRRFWCERTKKAAKDSDLAICLIWVTAFAERPMFAQVCASNQKQAGIIRRRALDILHWNPWLNDYVEIQREGIISKTLPEVVRTRIEATDSKGGAHGETPDILILNELVHVAKWQAMEDHLNNASGVPRGIVVVSTNAGYRGTKAETWKKNAAANSDRWEMLTWTKPAPWLDASDTKEAMSLNTPSEYDRLWRGKWASPAGDTLSETQIDKCFDPGRRKWLGPKLGWFFLAGLDLGVTHDHSGLAVLGVNLDERRLRVAWTKGWEPAMPVEDRLEVDLQAVESACRWVHKTFHPQWFGFDPAAGGSFMAQNLRRRGVPMSQVTFSQTNLTAMAVSFMQVIQSGMLECYDDEEGRLRRDFGKMLIVPRIPSGYKLEATSDEFGHADVGTALVLILPTAVKALGGISSIEGVDFSDWNDDTELSEKEIEQLPDEFREIFEEEYDEQPLGRRQDVDRLI